MQKCVIYHTGVYMSANGVIKDKKVYFQRDHDKLYFPEEVFMAREECEGGLIQFEVEGKWGFADIYTGEIKIKPIWDYVGPFYRGYAHVVSGAQVEVDSGRHIEIQGGKHGYLDITGNIIIPVKYDDAREIPYREYFMVAKNGKWGVVNQQNKIMIPLIWNTLEISYKHDLIFCSRKEIRDGHIEIKDRLLESNDAIKEERASSYVFKWGIYDQSHNLIVEPEVDEIICPMIKHSPRSKSFSYYEKYYILKRNRKYGIICNDGRWIANIKFSKKQAIAMINTISREYTGDLYI